MKCQSLLSENDISISKCHLLQFYKHESVKLELSQNLAIALLQSIGGEIHTVLKYFEFILIR